MTELIKQRLVGMLIVVIAGVVFIPDLLDGQKQTSKSDFKKIPESPEFNAQPKLTEFPSETVKENIAKIPSSEEEALDELVDVNDGSASENAEFRPQETSLASSEEVLAATQTAQNSQNPQVSSPTINDTKPDVTQSADSETKTVAEQATVQVSKPKKEVVASRYKKPLYILQLGSFKHKENVTTLRDKLKQAGYETYTKPVKTKSGVLSKVYIGPESDKETLEKAQVKLKELTGLVGKITRFEPTN